MSATEPATREITIRITVPAYYPDIDNDLERIALLVAPMLAEGADRDFITSRVMPRKFVPSLSDWPPREAQP